MSSPHPARYWRADGEAVVCELCPHLCHLREGEVGACGVRRNLGGRLVTDSYGLAAAARPSPIERQFLYHVMPGAQTFAFAGPGCNLRCRYCQNWLVSQTPKHGGLAVPGRELDPAAVIAEAHARGCQAIASTYTEPGISFEYSLEVARRAKDAGLPVVWKSAGYLQPEPVAEALGYLTAINIDLKSFRDETYRWLTGSRLAPVLATLRQVRAAGVWLEVTTLVVPGVNDSAAELADIAAFLHDELGPATPWHLNRFHPDHQLTNHPPTPRAALHEACRLGRAAGLRYTYTDAEAAGDGWNTLCPGCGTVAIRREQYAWRESRLTAGRCAACGTALDGVALGGEAGGGGAGDRGGPGGVVPEVARDGAARDDPAA